MKSCCKEFNRAFEDGVFYFSKKFQEWDFVGHGKYNDHIVYELRFCPFCGKNVKEVQAE